MMGLENVAGSVITPTNQRPVHVGELVENLNVQTLPPAELILVHAPPRADDATEIAGDLRGASCPGRDPCASS
jgi:hypothetical protein